MEGSTVMLKIKFVSFCLILANTLLNAQGIKQTEGRKLSYVEKNFEKVITSDDYFFNITVGGIYQPIMKKITIISDSSTVKNPTVLVNEGSDYTSVSKLGKTLFKGLTTDKEKVFKMFQFNSWQNMGDGNDPDERDPIKLLNIKGYGYCSHQNHETFARFLVEHGVRSKFLDIYQHSTAEEYYEGKWHYFDVYKEFAPVKPDGDVASFAEIKSNPDMMVYAGDDYAMMPGGGFSTTWSAYSVNFATSSGYEREPGHQYYVMTTTLDSGQSKIREWPAYEDLIQMGGYDYAPPSLPALSLGENNVFYYDDSDRRKVTVKYEWTEVYDAGTIMPEWKTKKLTDDPNMDIMYPRAAIDNNNIVHLVWEEINKANGEGKVYYGILDTLTNTIINKVQVSEDGVYSCRSDICFDDTNGVHIVFMGNASQNNLYERSVSEVGLNDIYYVSGKGNVFSTPENLTADVWWHYFLYPRVFESDGKIYVFSVGPDQSSTDYQGKPQDNSHLYAVGLYRWQWVKSAGSWGDPKRYDEGWMGNYVNYAKDHNDNIYSSISIYESKLKVTAEVNNPLETDHWFMTGMKLYDPLGAAIAVNADNNEMYYTYSGKVNGYDNSIYLAVKEIGSWTEDLLLSDDKQDKGIKCVYPQIAVGSNNRIQVAWQERDNYSFNIPRRDKWRIAVKTFDGSEWSAKAIISKSNNFDNKIPQVYIDSNNKTYLFWHGFSSGSGEIYLAMEGKEEVSDKEAPTPNPMTFKVMPHIDGAKISMTASMATDASGGVEYYFECTSDNSHNSGWQSSTSYVDSNLTIGIAYCYRVMARDANGNESVASDEECIYIKELDIYVEKNGSCIMEAENAFVNNNGDNDANAGLILWYEEAIDSGYVGSGYMTTKNGVTWNAKWNKATELLWKVNIYTAGEYYLATRKKSLSNMDNSSFMGVDSSQKGGSEFTTIDTEFTWNHGSVSLGHLGVGMHTVHVRRREDGFMLDRVMIALSESDLPAVGSTEIGLAESARIDTAITAIEYNPSNLVPNDFLLNPAYPNPFNPSTTISYGLPKMAHVKIAIYDINGRLISILQDSKQSAGYHNIIWNTSNSNGRSVSSGIYFYRIVAGNQSAVGKLIYLR